MGAAYIELNGQACINAKALQNEAAIINSGPLSYDFNFGDWLGKANSFCHRRGVDPSEGYLIVTNAAVTNSPTGLRIRFDDGNWMTFSDIKIEWAKKISPAKSDDDGYTLVKLTDSRRSLKDTLVGERFNVVIEYVPPEDQTQNGKFKYDKDTINYQTSASGAVISENPWTWSELFDKVFKLSGGQTLNKAGITFPAMVPQDLDWRYVTRRDAAEMLLQWSGLTILPTTEGYKLAFIEDSGKNKITRIINAYDPLALSKDRHFKFKEISSPVPSKFIIHFRKLHPEKAEISEYEKITKDASGSPKSKDEVSIRLPVYHTGQANVPEAQQPEKAASAWIASTNKLLAMFPPLEKTYRGFRLNPPSNDIETLELKMLPSEFIESVTWFDIGDGAKTLMRTVTVRSWIITPEKLDHPKEGDVDIALGKVWKTTAAAEPIIIVDELTLVAGSLGDGVEGGKTLPDPNAFPPGKTLDDYKNYFVTTYNFHKLDYVKDDTIMLWKSRDSTTWDTNNGKGEGGSELINFELAEDKSVGDFARKAFLLDPATADRLYQPDTTIPIEIYVADRTLKYHGYKSYTDPIYGEQRGYRGTAKYIFDFNGLPLHEIIEMEHVARFVEGHRPVVESDSFNSPTGSGGGSFADNFVIVDRYYDGRPPKTSSEGGPPKKPPTNPPSNQAGILFLDTQNLFGKLSNNGNCKMIWDDRAERYVIWVSEPVILSNVEFGVMFETLGGAGEFHFEGVEIGAEGSDSDVSATIRRGLHDLLLMKIKSMPSMKLVPKLNSDQKFQWFTPINVSKSILRSDHAEPIIAIGQLLWVPPITDQSDPDYTASDRGEIVFVVQNVMDPRAFWKYAKDKRQILWHNIAGSIVDTGGLNLPDADTSFQLDAQDCTPPE